MDKTALGNRMKRYEAVSKHTFTGRTPVIIRIDGKAFHTYTKPLKDPFNQDMHRLMAETTHYLVNNIQNAVIGYTQSDEISILLTDWSSLTTEQWFDGKQSKIESIAASMTTGIFNFLKTHHDDCLSEITQMFAMFDARAFNIPREEVCNYFIWRQQDATRNSIQMLGHDNFSQKQMHGKNTSQIQDMLMEHHNINWNDLEVWMKRGCCAMRPVVDESDETKERSTFMNKDIPIFTKDRDFIEQYLR